MKINPFGDDFCYWEHGRFVYAVAALYCRLFGHTPNTYEGGDCSRCGW